MKLQYLNFSSSGLSSSIPPQLEDLDLSFNSLSGLVPADLRGLRNLKNMIIGKNSLGGSSDNLFATLLQL